MHFEDAAIHGCKCPPTQGETMWPCALLPGSIARWQLSRRMQRFEKLHQRSSLRGTKVFPIRRHVTAALNHLADQLVRGKAQRNLIERRSTLSAFSAERMAVVTLLRLKDKRTLMLKRSMGLQELRRNRLTAPGVHHRTPRRVLRK